MDSQPKEVEFPVLQRFYSNRKAYFRAFWKKMKFVVIQVVQLLFFVAANKINKCKSQMTRLSISKVNYYKVGPSESKILHIR